MLFSSIHHSYEVMILHETIHTYVLTYTRMGIYQFPTDIDKQIDGTLKEQKKVNTSNIVS